MLEYWDLLANVFTALLRLGIVFGAIYALVLILSAIKGN
jgi:hypothetical protein